MSKRQKITRLVLKRKTDRLEKCKSDTMRYRVSSKKRLKQTMLAAKKSKN